MSWSLNAYSSKIDGWRWDRGRKCKKESGPKELVDWAEIFDLFFSEYGWSQDQVWQMTMRQVVAYRDKIEIRNWNKIAVKVKLAGGKMDFKTNAKEVEISEEDEQKIDKAIKDAVKRKVESKLRT